MKMKIHQAVCSAVLSLLALCAATASAGNPPQFTDYPVVATDQSRSGTRPPLRLTTRTARRYTTAIHRAYSEPPNFAGHLHVVIWGCGTDCRNFALIDYKTGLVHTLPNVDEIGGEMGNDDERVDFRSDSRLLIIAGTLDHGQSAGKFYYLWTGKRLERVFTEPLVVDVVR
jgi:hypothetical protein